MKKNLTFLQQLVYAMYKIHDFSSLDEYGTAIFERPIWGTWKLLRHIVKEAVEDGWMWSPDKEVAGFPQVDVPSYEVFATYILHEATHGWCFFQKKTDQFQYPTGVDEEQVCWDVSKLICAKLGIMYAEAEADESHRFHKAVQRGDMDEVARLMERMPEHCKMAGE